MRIEKIENINVPQANHFESDKKVFMSSTDWIVNKILNAKIKCCNTFLLSEKNVTAINLLTINQPKTERMTNNNSSFSNIVILFPEVKYTTREKKITRIQKGKLVGRGYPQNG